MNKDVFEFKININKIDYESYTILKNKYYFEESLELKDDIKIPLILNHSVINNKTFTISLKDILGYVLKWYYDKVIVKINHNHMNTIQTLDIDKVYPYCLGSIKNNIGYPIIIIAFSLEKF